MLICLLDGFFFCYHENPSKEANLTMYALEGKEER